MPTRYPRGVPAYNDSPATHDADDPVFDAPPTYSGAEFRQTQRTEVVGEWPAHLRLSMSMFMVGGSPETRSEQVKINEKGFIVIRVDNGFAIYKLAEYQDSNYYLNCDLKKSKIYRD